MKKQWLMAVAAAGLLLLGGCGTGASDTASAPETAGAPLEDTEASALMEEYVRYIQEDDLDAFSGLFVQSDLDRDFVQTEFETEIDWNSCERMVRVIASDGAQAYLYMLTYPAEGTPDGEACQGYAYLLQREDGSWRFDSHATQREYQALLEEGARTIYGEAAMAAKASTTLESPLADLQGYLPGSCGAELQVVYQNEDGASFARVYLWNGTEQEAGFSSLSTFVLEDDAGKTLADLSGIETAAAVPARSGVFLELQLPEGFSLPESIQCRLEPVYTVEKEAA